MNPRLERLLLATSLIAASAYAVAAENPAMLLVAWVGVIASWSIVQARGGKALPMSATIPLTLAAVGYAMLRLVGEGFRVSVFSEFVLALLIVKLVDRRSSRDNAQVLLLSVFLVVGAILTSNRLLLAMLILVFVPVFGATVVRHQIEATREAASASGDRPAGPISPGERLDLRRLVWFLTLGSLVVSIGIFVLMPRGVGVQAFGAWGNTSLGSVTSFTDEVQLGRGGLISQSSTPVLDLQVRSVNGNTLGSASQVFYLRGAVLDSYENGSWRRSSKSQATLGPGQEIPLGADGTQRVANLPASASDVELHITMRNIRSGETHLFSTWRPIEFETLSPMWFKRNMRDGTMLRSGQPGKYEYIVRCLELARDATLEQASRSPVSFPSESITSLTQRLFRESEVPVDLDPLTRPLVDTSRGVRIIRNYLVSNYAYSLETRTPPPLQDPTEWFLFGEDRRGHCEYFASAMAAMCRSVGINSRVVTGYVATEWNSPTSHYIVRESNAHAWVEVEVQPGFWQRQDPTPTWDLDAIHKPSQSILARVRRMLDTAEYAWINSVVGFNRRSRSSMVDSSIDGAMTSWSQDLGERVRAGGLALGMRAFAAGLISFAFTMAIGLLLVWLARGPWKGAAQRLASMLPRLRLPLGRLGAQSTHELLRSDLLRLFERLGRPKPAWRPLRAHAQVIRAHADGAQDAGPVIQRVIGAIYRERFGAETLNRDRVARDRSDLARLTRVARKRPSGSDSA